MNPDCGNVGTDRSSLRLMVFTDAAVNSPARKNSARGTASRWSELTPSSPTPFDHRVIASAIARQDRAGRHEGSDQPMPPMTPSACRRRLGQRAQRSTPPPCATLLRGIDSADDVRLAAAHSIHRPRTFRDFDAPIRPTISMHSSQYLAAAVRVATCRRRHSLGQARSTLQIKPAYVEATLITRTAPGAGPLRRRSGPAAGRRRGSRRAAADAAGRSDRSPPPPPPRRRRSAPG